MVSDPSFQLRFNDKLKVVVEPVAERHQDGTESIVDLWPVHYDKGLSIRRAPTFESGILPRPRVHRVGIVAY